MVSGVNSKDRILRGKSTTLEFYLQIHNLLCDKRKTVSLLQAPISHILKKLFEISGLGNVLSIDSNSRDYFFSHNFETPQQGKFVSR